MAAAVAVVGRADANIALEFQETIGISGGAHFASNVEITVAFVGTETCDPEQPLFVDDNPVQARPKAAH